MQYLMLLNLPIDGFKSSLYKLIGLIPSVTRIQLALITLY